MENDSIYFMPGMVLTLKQDLPNKPIMLVVRKETSLFKHESQKFVDKKPILIGIRCRWFTDSGELQEAVFSTKDLLLIK